MGCSESKKSNADVQDVNVEVVGPKPTKPPADNSFVLRTPQKESIAKPRKTFTKLERPADADAACVIWLHGIAQTGDSWVALEIEAAAEMDWLQWCFPEAERRPVSILAFDEEPAWFDLSVAEPGISCKGPLDTDAGKLEAGLGGAVATVHALLDEAVALGFNSERLLLGGFSQGAALAVLAGRMYGKRLGGIVGWAGWLLRPDGLHASSPRVDGWSHKANAQTPILLCSVDDSESLPIGLANDCVDKLRASGADVTHCVVAGGHADLASNKTALAELGSFLSARFPKAEPVDCLLSGLRPVEAVGARIFATLDTEKVGGPNFLTIRIERLL